MKILYKKAFVQTALFAIFGMLVSSYDVSVLFPELNTKQLTRMYDALFYIHCHSSKSQARLY